MVTDPILSFDSSWAPRRITRLFVIYFAVATIPPTVLFVGYEGVGIVRWLHAEHPWWLEACLIVVLVALFSSLVWDYRNRGSGAGFGFVSLYAFYNRRSIFRSMQAFHGGLPERANLKTFLITVVFWIAVADFPNRIELRWLSAALLIYWHAFLRVIWLN